MYAKLLCAAVIASGTLSMAAFAEAPVQAGETLESLSQVKVTTTINGQPGSLAELVNSGKVQLISDQQTAPQTTGQTPMAPADASLAPPAPAAHDAPPPPHDSVQHAAPAQPQDQNLNAAPAPEAPMPPAAE